MKDGKQLRKDTSVKRLLILFTVILVSLLLVSCGLAQEPPIPRDPQVLGFDIEFDKTSYHIGEPIKLKVTLKNISDTDVIVKDRLIVSGKNVFRWNWDIMLFFETSSGKSPIPRPGITDYPLFTNDIFISLHPGEIIETECHLLSIFQFEGAGEYLVSAVYQNSMEPTDGREVWRGALIDSENLTIEP